MSTRSTAACQWTVRERNSNCPAPDTQNDNERTLENGARYDQRNTSDKKNQHMQQFADILRTFINAAIKYESRSGKVRDEEKTSAFKMLMPERPLNFRFRGTTITYDEIILDKVMTKPVASDPMDIGMAAKDDVSESNGEEEQLIGEIAVQH